MLFNGRFRINIGGNQDESKILETFIYLRNIPTYDDEGRTI